MAVPVTAFYAILLTLIGSYLAYRIGKIRGGGGPSILWGDDMNVALEVRRHGNFSEFVPLALVLMVIAELNGVSSGVLHGVGLLLVASRIAHPMGLRADDTSPPLRALGAGGTFLATLVLVGTIGWKLI